MSEIVKIIKNSRKDGLSDRDVLGKIAKVLPEKKKAFKEAQERGASPTQILDKILADNSTAVSKKGVDISEVIEIIDTGRKNYLKDEDVIREVVKILPEKKKAFEEAQERGASPTQILDKILADNKKGDVEKKEKALEKEEKEVVKPGIKEEVTKEPAAKTQKKKQNIKKTIAGIKGTHFFSEFFAITRYLLVGIDISDHSVEILLLDSDGTITSHGRSILEEGIIYNGEVLNQKRLSESLKEALRRTKPHPLDIQEHTIKKKVTLRKKNHKAIISLPESKTYVHLFSFPDKSNLYAKIEEKIKNTIPFDYEDLYWDFTEIPSKKKDVKILCVAAQRDIVDSYIYFFKSANVDPVAFDIQGSSIGRALLPTKKIYEDRRKKKTREVMADGKSKMIIDMGSKTTTLSIFNEDAILAVSVPLPYAGNYFTKKIAEGLKISHEDANKIKKEDGFKKDGRAYDIVKKNAMKIVDEINDARNYYKREFEVDVNEVIIAGGTALMPEMVEFFSAHFEEIVIKKGEPLKKINDLDLLGDENAILYSNVIGLALRSLLKDPIRDGINLLPEEIKNQERRSQTEKHRSVLLIAIFIAIAGIMFLVLAAYYLIYLPVPAPIQPLKHRVLLHLDDDKVVYTVDVAVVRDDGEGVVFVRRGPGETQEVIGEAIPGESYEVTAQLAGWVRVKFEEGEGWIYGEDLDSIDTVDITEDESANEVVEISGDNKEEALEDEADFIEELDELDE